MTIPLPEPKPCPFCGHVGLKFIEASTNFSFRFGQSYCAGCGASIGYTRKHDEWHRDAINEWNERKGEQAYGDARAQEAREAEKARCIAILESLITSHTKTSGPDGARRAAITYIKRGMTHQEVKEERLRQAYKIEKGTT